MFNIKTVLFSTLLLTATVPAFAASDCCKEKEGTTKKECCEKKMKCCDDKDKTASQEDHSHHGH
ncbi:MULTISPECIES: hypothetical protein [Acinetobacter]|uniref:Uncharacterized protein n=1 Tax=Acinetobacter higginsii TaxID=70347 RepID=N9STD5_9GAMM|nr:MULTISPECIES: hypothetical protein [Acinetobacter]ENX57916.1 hypothetical protein F902_02316 [Acinetobacter higginsii]MCI3878167.1 hypothetical protein [Acinetobacter higginsii]